MTDPTNRAIADGRPAESKPTTGGDAETAQISRVNVSVVGWCSAPRRKSFESLVRGSCVVAIAELRKSFGVIRCASAIPLVVAAVLDANPADAHCYSYWAYKTPQHCRAGHFVRVARLTEPPKEVRTVPLDKALPSPATLPAPPPDPEIFLVAPGADASGATTEAEQRAEAIEALRLMIERERAKTPQ